MNDCMVKKNRRIKVQLLLLHGYMRNSTKGFEVDVPEQSASLIPRPCQPDCAGLSVKESTRIMLALGEELASILMPMPHIRPH